MIQRNDILSMEYLKKTEFTGCHRGMRYRLEGIPGGDEKRLQATVWPEPFNFLKTPKEQQASESFSFDEDGVAAAVAWMNERYLEKKEYFENASKSWKEYRME